MRLMAGLVLVLAALGLAVLWGTGILAQLGWWLQTQQQAAQNALGTRITTLRTDPMAIWGFVALCGAYGFLHALGPGHGKVLITGAAIGTRATARRMALIALAGSLGQAGLALVIVYGSLSLLDLTARNLTDGAGRVFEVAGAVAIAMIGAWLALRGTLAFQASAGRDGHDHDHAKCNHAHGPSLDETARATSLGATAALIAGIAARPCTGALVILVIAWRMGAPGAGAAGVFAMGLGTALFTVMIAVLAVSSREATLLSAGSARTRYLGPLLQVGAGVLLFALGTLPLLAV